MNGLQRLVLWALAWIERYRYLKFAIVGASGTVVNLVVLHIGHEYIFRSIEADYQKPYISLVFAILIATINNFTWNRLWTWSDRVKTLEAAETAEADKAGKTGGRVSLRTLSTEFGQYVTASAFGSTLQYVLTLLLSGFMDYRQANILAIVVAAVSNYLANDRWTFRKR